MVNDRSTPSWELRDHEIRDIRARLEEIRIEYLGHEEDCGLAFDHAVCDCVNGHIYFLLDLVARLDPSLVER